MRANLLILNRVVLRDSTIFLWFLWLLLGEG
jgi:hypothetical protein